MKANVTYEVLSTRSPSGYGGRTKRYEVRVSCTCPDAVYRQSVCKHIRGLLDGELSGIEVEEAQREGA